MSVVSLKSAAGKWIMASSILASFMAFIDGTALDVVLPSLQENLQASGKDRFLVQSYEMCALLAFLGAVMFIIFIRNTAVLL